jgi:aerobic carbon-monoxide dehydrogenase medium subunit
MSVRFHRPETLEQAFEALASDDDAHLLAGGVSVVLLMTSGLMAPSTLVSLDGVDGLDEIRSLEGSLSIGARTTHHELATHPVVAERFAAMGEMFSLIGNVRVRMAGTIGGNLAHADPAQDPAVMLSVLGAKVRVAGPDGERDVAVEELADGPFSPTLAQDEIITQVMVPWPSDASACSYIKFLSGTHDDYATVSVACRLEVDPSGEITSASLAAGAVGPTVVPLEEAARVLVGSRPDTDVLGELERVVAESVSPNPDRRGSADYKRAMTGVVASRAVEKALAGDATARASS